MARESPEYWGPTPLLFVVTPQPGGPNTPRPLNRLFPCQEELSAERSRPLDQNWVSFHAERFHFIVCKLFFGKQGDKEPTEQRSTLSPEDKGPAPYTNRGS